MANIFLSYARGDFAYANKLALALIESGWSVWWDQDIRAGEVFRAIIRDELNKANCVVVIWSRVSVSSHFVLDEATVASKQNKLVSVCIDGTSPPLGFNQFQWIDISSWILVDKTDIFAKLKRDIQKLIPEAVKARDMFMLDTRGITKAEHSGLKEVWVFSRDPLECAVGEYNLELRRQVFKNMVAGVKYTYWSEPLV